MTYEVRFTHQAVKDIKALSSKLQTKLKEILRNRIATDPYSGKALLGDLKGYFSVRLSYKDRIVYSIDDGVAVVLVIRAKTHHGD